MRSRSIILCASLLAVVPTSPAGAAPPVPLEAYPVCEASAALAVACSDDPGATCVWVADNEQNDALFQYRIGEDGLLAPGDPFAIPLDGVTVGDIESLATDQAVVLVIGSHSRTRSCKKDDARVAVARITQDPRRVELLAGSSGFDDRTKACDSRWLVLAEGESAAAAALGRDFCAAVAAGEEGTRSGAPQSCAGATFDVEGAVFVPDASGAERLWLGLSAPQLKGLAVLLRAAPIKPGSKRLTFDGIATIDLRGAGIRELTLAEGWLWGIAGTAADSAARSHLWRVRADRLQVGAVIGGVEMVAGGELPPGAEGLVILPEQKRALVVIDGDTGDQEGRCKVGARQMTIALPE
jgi:hypothetical protein